ncbi:hypothetical protein E6C70_10035 [Glaciibacter flavus]|uniref:Uncharacterized protein n=1 Tax=Orlajensenia flava TaxID=2565934 RepID=A0A4V6RZ45_9MICO|nr:glycosyltransferase family 39 protein [Glaciibacter flavus]THG34147.1 hypothetical protein E6C70_10035 [Glaciibacter flavus]
MTTQSLSGWAVAPTTRARSAVRGRAVPAITVGLAGTAVALAGASSPSYWGDEAASVMSAERSIPALFAMLGNVDAVHGLYYLFLHFWIGVFGTSELATRAPSAIAVGVAAAGVLTLMRRFTSLRVAVLASVVFLLLPRIAYAGIEARSYAMGAAVAVWLTVWFARLVASRRARMLEWIGFGAAVGASAYLFLYLLLLAPVYAIVLLITPGLRQRVRGGLLAGTAAVLVAAPMVLAAVGQRGQVSFLARRDYANAYSVLVDQWFGWVPLAVAAWLLIIVGVIAAKRLSPNRRQGVVLLVVWLVLPTAALLIGNALLAPMYNIRYLTFCAPAAAMLVAVGAAAVPGVIERMRSARAARRSVRGLPTSTRRLRASTLTLEIVAVVAILALPVCIAERGPFAKDDGSDLRQAATAVDHIAQTGDAIVFDSATRPSQRPRLALRLYPQDFAGTVDVGLRVPYTQRAELWDTVAPVSALAPELSSFRRVIAVELRGSASVDLAALEAQGFVVEAVHHVHRTDIYTLTREIA